LLSVVELISSIAHEFLGQLGKAGVEWRADLIPASLMREIVISIEKGDINGGSLYSSLEWFVWNPAHLDRNHR
jgi:hypothetical protein